MPLVKIEERPIYDTAQIKRGDLLYARHRSWTEGLGGIVTGVREDTLTVQYHPRIGNVTNHFHIPVTEAADGQWEIRWSTDLTEINSVEMSPEESGETEETDGGA